MDPKPAQEQEVTPYIVTSGAVRGYAVPRECAPRGGARRST